VRPIRFHDLRHTYASTLLMLGARLVSVQKLLGHSDPKITERRYGHLLPDFMKLEVDRPGSGSACWRRATSPPGPKVRGRNPSGFPRSSGLFSGGVCGARTRGLRRDRPAL
jgi:hypothetical protein